MLNRSKLWALMLLVGVFAAGVAVGGPAWGAMNDNPNDDRSRRSSSSEPRNRERRSYSDNLQESLGLSAEQRASVDSILGESQSEMRRVWREMRAEIDTLRQDVSQDIMQLLDDGQQAKYRELMDRSRRRGERERATRENRNHE